MRREFSKSVKLAAWERCGGRCEICTAKLFTGRITYDHIIPDGLGGEPVLSNVQVLCDNCNHEKTYTGDCLISGDISRIAKTKRVRDKHIGITDRKSSFAANRNGPFRVRINGMTERR